MLTLTEVQASYGKIQALKGINLEVRQGEIVALLGSNGAGKSTTLKTISGLLRLNNGEIFFEGSKITGVPPHKIVESGLIHVPEGRRIFTGLTVIENLELGGFTIRKNKQFVQQGIEQAFALFPRLQERSKQIAGTLSGGEQQMLAICRGLMARPKLLMLDEPSMGLAPIIVNEIMTIIKEINRQGTTILLIEQNAKAALRLAHRGYVMETGRITIENTAEKLREDETIVKAYLGA
ncbi:ABC transporter ATP-binding protein [Brevibacillus sp. SYSU BS000544]|uniref:ABC transporter ATP-binding protein n=1 Tax=Brevibacillus sp. SYSU BS000544 TaxID=3416443 RepID=UPI003CE47D09